jgi:hypothetical protein
MYDPSQFGGAAPIYQYPFMPMQGYPQMMMPQQAYQQAGNTLLKRAELEISEMAARHLPLATLLSMMAHTGNRFLQVIHLSA